MTAGNSQFHFIASTSTYLEPVVRPAPELHLAALVVEGEPGDVDLAGGLEHAGRDVGAEARTGDHHVGGECRVETLAGAVGQVGGGKW